MIITTWLYGRIGSRNTTADGTAIASAQNGRSINRHARYDIGPTSALHTICRSCNAYPAPPTPPYRISDHA
ncbi:hypothetical protein, partial [Kitasatospora sp. MBT63]|uniref:hypothetical protein n=1 Tax=Kitasatospora sp. MBT63 TaxID=1444768 RepID=UPI0019D6BC6E